MSSMFKRYPPPSRRAIFYARESALHAGATEIDSIHLLWGLTLERTSRANTVFRLDERFPEESARMRTLKRATDPKEIPLSPEVKKVLVYAADEANHIDSYWIDTDHLTLGILRQRDCAATAKLGVSGLLIEEARKQVESSSDEREQYGPIPMLWRLEKPISRIGHVAGFMYLVLLVVLISLVTGKGC